MAGSIKRGAMVLFKGDLAFTGVVWENFTNDLPYSYVAFSALDEVVLTVCRWSDLTTDPEETEGQRAEALLLAHDYILYRAGMNAQIGVLTDQDLMDRQKRRAIEAFEEEMARRWQAINGTLADLLAEDVRPRS